jgi:hypothetical protein
MFFNSFPTTKYNFSKEGNAVEIADIFRQIKIVDKRFDSATPYQFYEVQDERPDQLSNRLYGDPNYHWVFFVINDTLKGGHKDWPMTNIELRDYVETKYPLDNYTITLFRNADDPFNFNSIHNKFRVGDTLRGFNTGAEATILERNPEVNQLVIKYTTSAKFSSDEQIIDTVGAGIIETNRVISSYADSVAFYKDSNSEIVSNADNYNRSDISVSYTEMETDLNDNRRFIRVLRDSYIRDFVISYRKLING